MLLLMPCKVDNLIRTRRGKRDLEDPTSLSARPTHPPTCQVQDLFPSYKWPRAVLPSDRACLAGCRDRSRQWSDLRVRVWTRPQGLWEDLHKVESIWSYLLKERRMASRKGNNKLFVRRRVRRWLDISISWSGRCSVVGNYPGFLMGVVRESHKRRLVKRTQIIPICFVGKKLQ